MTCEIADVRRRHEHVSITNTLDIEYEHARSVAPSVSRHGTMPIAQPLLQIGIAAKLTSHSNTLRLLSLVEPHH
jgi:hypothetical protein